MRTGQPGIFAVGTRDHYHLELDLRTGVPVDVMIAGLRELSQCSELVGVNLVVGFGAGVWPAIAPRRHVPTALRAFIDIEGIDGLRAPATQHDLWVWLHGTGKDAMFDAAQAVRRTLCSSMEVRQDQPCFVYHDSRDLTGFIDGTANPTLSEAIGVALIGEDEPGEGGSFALVQQWEHDLDSFHALGEREQELVIGRTKPESIELTDDEKPDDAHIARTEVTDEEGNEIEIFRRSVPWGTATRSGLYFVAFAADPGRFDLLLGRMYGTVDGVRDRLLDFSRPISGSYYFVPALETLDELIGLGDVDVAAKPS